MRNIGACCHEKSTMIEANPYELPSVATTHEQDASDRSRLRKIAVAHRQVNLAILYYLCVVPISGLVIVGESAMWAKVVFGVIGMAVLDLGVVSVYNLAEKLRGKTVAIVHAVGLLIPFLGLILLMTNSREATKMLQANGINVALFGANPETI